jgi:MinD-like ATPase involved in chromosome partitioning or flagellar assembly
MGQTHKSTTLGATVELPAQPEPAPSPNGHLQKSRPAELARRAAILESAPVFGAASDGELRSLARRLTPLHQAAGATVVAQGQRTTCLYLIASGCCRLAVENPSSSGEAVPVAELGPGEFFGEASFFSNSPAPQSAVAITDLSLLVLERQGFHTVFGPDTDIAIELGRLAHQRATMHRDLAARADQRMASGAGSLVAVYSPKGGTGRTTVALNLAAQLAAAHPHQVVLLDLSYPFNHAALMSSLVPVSSLARIGQAPPEEFEGRLVNAILQHPQGLHVLPSVLKNEEIELVNADLVSRAIELLRVAHRYVIVDMGTGLNDAALSVFESSDDILVVVTPELAAAKAAADTLEIFTALELPPNRVTIVLNHRSAKPALTRPAVEQALRRRVQFEIAYEDTRPDESALKASFLVLDAPNGGMARVLRNVTKLIDSHRREPSAERGEALTTRGTRALIRLLESRIERPAMGKGEA